MELVYKLYFNRLLSSWGDRTWEFAIGLYLIKLYPSSLLLAAIQGILNSSATILFAPIIGRWVETANRLKEVKICLIIQNGSVVMSSLFVAIYFGRDEIQSDSFRKAIELTAPIILVLFSIIAQVTSIGYTLVLEKDWIIAISENEEKLTDLNAMLRRLDLTCQTIAPFLVGILMQYTEFGSALFFLIWNFVSGFIEYAVLKSIYNQNVPGLLKPKTTTKDNSLHVIDMDAIKKYKDGFLTPGIGFGILYLSILGFDSVTIGFITSRGIGEGYVGIVSLFAGVLGILGTLIYQCTVKILNVKKAGLIGYFLDLSALTICLISILYSKFNPGFIFGIEPIYLFLFGITLSRTGLWMIDLSVNQLIQTETCNPPVIGGVQTSVNIFAELFKFTIVAFLPSLSSFWILVLISYLSVATGTILFIVYNCRQKKFEKEESKDYGTFSKPNS